MLVFNEPEHASQGNLTPQQAADKIRELSFFYPQARLIIGGVGYWGQEWLKKFVPLLNGWIPQGWHVHGYAEAWAESRDIINYWTWARTFLPGLEFWITEFADTNGDGKELINFVRSCAWVNRYAWFANRLDGNEPWYPQHWVKNPALIMTNGTLSEYGVLYTSQ